MKPVGKCYRHGVACSRHEYGMMKVLMRQTSCALLTDRSTWIEKTTLRKLVSVNLGNTAGVLVGALARYIVYVRCRHHPHHRLPARAANQSCYCSTFSVVLEWGSVPDTQRRLHAAPSQVLPARPARVVTSLAKILLLKTVLQRVGA